MTTAATVDDQLSTDTEKIPMMISGIETLGDPVSIYFEEETTKVLVERR